MYVCVCVCIYIHIYTGWSKCLCARDVLYCNRQVHRDFLITVYVCVLYVYMCVCVCVCVCIYTGWSKCLCARDVLYCNRQVHRDFLITLYVYVCIIALVYLMYSWIFGYVFVNRTVANMYRHFHSLHHLGIKERVTTYQCLLNISSDSNDSSAVTALWHWADLLVTTYKHILGY